MVRPRGAAIPEWIEVQAYAPMLQLERAGFAWEWLRRQPDYAAAARKALDRAGLDRGTDDRCALAWNLHAFEDPELPAPEARPMWTAAAHPWVVLATAEPSPPNEDALDLGRLAAFSSLIRSSGVDRLLLSDGCRSVRLDVRGVGVGCSPVRLSYDLAGIQSLERPLLVLRRLRAVASCGRFRPSLHPRVRRAHRLVQLLRTHDAIDAGASQADIAQFLVRPGLERSRWRIHSPSIRSQAQRLVASARRMHEGAFWHLLA